MTNVSVIENKISSAKNYLKILERYKHNSREEIENNIDLKGAVERYLYLASQSTIDLADAFISLKGFRKPSTLSDAFHILEEENIISKEITEKMVKMTGFRNTVAHDYAKINYEIVYDVLQNKLKDIEEFIDIIENKL